MAIPRKIMPVLEQLNDDFAIALMQYLVLFDYVFIRCLANPKRNKIVRANGQIKCVEFNFGRFAVKSRLRQITLTDQYVVKAISPVKLKRYNARIAVKFMLNR